MAHDHSKCINEGQHALHEVAERDGLTQEQLAEKGGVSQQTMSKYMAGRVPVRWDVLDKFKKEFDIDGEAFRRKISHPRRRRSSAASKSSAA